LEQATPLEKAKKIRVCIGVGLARDGFEMASCPSTLKPCRRPASREPSPAIGFWPEFKGKRKKPSADRRIGYR
jgi:hypothetical protein